MLPIDKAEKNFNFFLEIQEWKKFTKTKNPSRSAFVDSWEFFMHNIYKTFLKYQLRFRKARSQNYFIFCEISISGFATEPMITRPISNWSHRSHFLTNHWSIHQNFLSLDYHVLIFQKFIWNNFRKIAHKIKKKNWNSYHWRRKPSKIVLICRISDNAPRRPNAITSCIT